MTLADQILDTDEVAARRRFSREDMQSALTRRIEAEGDAA